MNGKIWIFGLIPVIASFFMLTGANAYEVSRAYQHGRVKVFGVVTNANPEAGTVTITVNRESTNIQDKFDKNVTFHVAGAVRLHACSTQPGMAKSCWNQLATRARIQHREAESGAQKPSLSQIKNGDLVYILGHFNKKSGEFTAREILKWQS